MADSTRHLAAPSPHGVNIRRQTLDVSGRLEIVVSRSPPTKSLGGSAAGNSDRVNADSNPAKLGDKVLGIVPHQLSWHAHLLSAVRSRSSNPMVQ